MNIHRDSTPAEREPGAGAPRALFPGLDRNLAIDPESAGRSLAGLVLTVVELLRELMERQAIRRVDQGDLTAEQVERIGATLMALDERMSELCDHFELTRDDLNLDLGPLGPAAEQGLSRHPIGDA